MGGTWSMHTIKYVFSTSVTSHSIAAPGSAKLSLLRAGLCKEVDGADNRRFVSLYWRIAATSPTPTTKHSHFYASRQP